MKEKSQQEAFMRAALSEAKKAYEKDEIPIGAVVVRDGRIIGRGHNTTETDRDPTAHAEITAIRMAAETLGGWRLTGCEMYVTAEPCSMCAGAMVLSRLERVFIGTENPKAGACLSLYRLLQDERLNHTVEMDIGLLREPCEALLKDFFQKLRKHRSESVIRL